MSKKRTHSVPSNSAERFVVRVKHNEEPDLRRLARALIEMALNQQAEAAATDTTSSEAGATLKSKGPEHAS